MFTLDISTGELTHDGRHIANGYSGRESGKDNPAYQSTPGFGPIPVGLYTIGIARHHPQLGQLAIPLKPDANNQMYGRSGFWIHGDSSKHPGEGSEGCICLPHDARAAIAASSDRRLTVISTTMPTPA